MMRLLLRLILTLGLLVGFIFTAYFFRYEILIHYLNFRLNKTPIEVLELSINPESTRYPTIYLDRITAGVAGSNGQDLFALTLRNTQLMLSGLPHQNPVITTLTSDSAEIHAAGFASLNPMSLGDLTQVLLALDSHSHLKQITLDNTTIMIDEPFPKNIAGKIHWNRKNITVDFNNTPTNTESPNSAPTVIYSMTMDHDENLTGTFQLSNSSIAIQTTPSTENQTNTQNSEPFVEIDFTILGKDLINYRLSNALDPTDRLAGKLILTSNTNTLETLFKQPHHESLKTHLISAQLAAHIARFDKFIEIPSNHITRFSQISLQGDFKILPGKQHDWSIENNDRSQIQTQGELLLKNMTHPFNADLTLPKGWRLSFTDANTYTLNGFTQPGQLEVRAEDIQLNATLNNFDLSRSEQTSLTSKISLTGTVKNKQLPQTQANVDVTEQEREVNTQANGTASISGLNSPTSFNATGNYETSKQQGILNLLFETQQGMPLVETLKSNENTWKPASLEQYLFRMTPSNGALSLEGRLPWHYWPPVFDTDSARYQHTFATAEDQ